MTKLKISKQTIDILKNLASVNQNIMFREGKTLMTRSVARNLFVSATTDTEFPQDFGIYNLSEFLGVVSLFSDPELTFGETNVTVSQGKNRVKYNYASAEILSFPDKAINPPEVLVEFQLTEENLKSLLKAGAVMSGTELKIVGNGETITCITHNPDNEASNTFSIDVGTTTETFSVLIKLENLKMVTGSYKVGLAKRLTKFENTQIDYQLYVANEQKSEWA